MMEVGRQRKWGLLISKNIDLVSRLGFSNEVVYESSRDRDQQNNQERRISPQGGAMVSTLRGSGRGRCKMFMSSASGLAKVGGTKSCFSYGVHSNQTWVHAFTG